MILLASTAAAVPGPLVFKATQPGHQTLDEGEGGGNPFASALIEALASQPDLGHLAARVRELTRRFSEGFQDADVPASMEPGDLPLAGRPDGTKKTALVLVYSNYLPATGLVSLAGAARDAHRVSEALTRAGFETTTLIDPPRADLPRLLADFSRRSAGSSLAMICTTGHGVEVSGVGYLLPNDFPVWGGSPALDRQAVRLDTLAGTLRAGRANLFFYGGCRDNPLGWTLAMPAHTPRNRPTNP